MLKWASQKDFALWLESCYLAFFHASYTKVMLWLAVLHAFPHGEHKTAGLELMKLIASSLAFKVFEFSQFVFKFGYLAGERCLFILGVEGYGSGSHELGAYLADCGDKLVVVAEAMCRLKKRREMVETLDNSSELGIHGSSPSN